MPNAVHPIRFIASDSTTDSVGSVQRYRSVGILVQVFVLPFAVRIRREAKEN